VTKFAPKTYFASSKVLIKMTSTLIGESKVLEEAFSIETNCEILRSRSFMESVVKEIKEKGKEKVFPPNISEVDFLLANVEILPLKKTDIIEIKVYGPSKEGVAIIANTIAQVFQQHSIQIARTKIIEKRKFIESQLPEVEKKLVEMENQIKRFKEKETLISIEKGGGSLQSELIKLESRYNEFVANIKAQKELIKELEKELKKEYQKLDEEIVREKTSSIEELRDKLIKLNKKYASYVIAGVEKGDPTLEELDKKIQKIKLKLKEEISTTTQEEKLLLVDPLFFVKHLSQQLLNEKMKLKELMLKGKAVKETLKEYQQKVKKFPEKECELAKLQRDYKVWEGLYKRLIEQYEETKITEVSEIGNVVIAEKAITPAFPLHPNPKRNLLLGVVFGVFFGVGCVVLVEFLDTSVKEIEEVKELKIPITGIIPFNSGNYIEEHFLEKIYMNLKFASPTVNGGIRKFLVTSILPGEGKSTIVYSLGKFYSKIGKTIIIEGDLRRPTLSKMYKVEEKEGVSNFLIGELKQVDEGIFPIEGETLYLMPAGYLPPNPHLLLESERMKECVVEVEKRFSTVIVDSPPLLSGSDSFFLSQIVEGVLLVVELGRVNKESLVENIKGLQKIGANFVGVVVNKVKERKYLSYNYYSYYRYKRKEET